MAGEETLFRFVSGKVDPALLVDHALQAERESLDLAEMSLLELVDSSRMKAELQKSAESIQERLTQILNGVVGGNFESPVLIDRRVLWLQARTHFYSRWMSYAGDVESPLELARKAFKRVKVFETSLEALAISDERYADELSRATTSLHRFLVRKHLDQELRQIRLLWDEFMTEAFKETRALP